VCNFTTGCRPPLNIQMLAKMRLVMVEKWYERYENQLRVLHAPCARRALLSTRVLTLSTVQLLTLAITACTTGRATATTSACAMRPRECRAFLRATLSAI
jgi:hypothetical protein